MQTFLEKTARYLLDTAGKKPDQMCVVLPNRRAGLFLKRNIAQLIDKPVWAPAVMSIEDFVFRISGFQSIEPVYLLFELYEIYRETDKESAVPFEEFLGWGQVVLNDFNDLDMHLTNADELFNFLNDVKALNLWNPDGTALTSFQVEYLRFFNSLAEFYLKLKERLLNSRKVYQGLAYRYLAEVLEQGSVVIPWNKIVFAGFNALTPAEEKIIQQFRKAGKAEILWDADRYYIDNAEQEAGRFLRKVIKNEPADNFKWISGDLKSHHKKIRLIGVPQKVGQVKAAGSLLRDWIGSGKNPDSTAVILNDESLLFPMLNSLPEELKEFNVTMGLPLKSTPPYKLINAMISMQENSLKFSRSVSGNRVFYYSDVLKVLEHSYIRLLLAGNGDEQKASLAKYLRSSNKSFYTPEEINERLATDNEAITEFFNSLFAPWQDSAGKAISVIRKLLQVLKITFQQNKGENNINKNLDMEYTYYFSRVLTRLSEIHRSVDFIEGLANLRYVFNAVLQSVYLPFYGEPLRGIQIMGMLESRTLDFENIIMLPVNEDYLPAGRSKNSFIPFEVRKTFQLPTIHDRTAVYAYHFYRLLQRSSNISLIYNTESGDLGGGEKSRFINQIQYELTKYNQEIEIEDQILSVDIPVSGPEPSLDINKSPDILTRLDAMAESGLSASSLNVYRNCSLQFYFTQVMGIEELKEVEETIEAATLGTVVHAVLQDLYSPLKHKYFLVSDIEMMKKRVPELIKRSFKKHYPDGETRFGKNLLIVKVAESYIQNFLRWELSFLQKLDRQGEKLLIEATEEKVRTSFVINDDKTVWLKGFIDRIDRVGETTRIIDYKTGRVEQRELKLDSYDQIRDSNEFSKGFQLLFYTYLYQKQNPENQSSMLPGIISFRNLGAGLLKANFEEAGDKDWPASFEHVLKEILQEIYDPAIPFTKTDEPKNCEYCLFKGICNR